MNHRMTAPLFIFDLDNTLYPKGLPIWRMVDDRIEQYVIGKLRTDRDTARRVRMQFLARFGSTLRGLMHHHGVRPAEYLEYIHDVPIPELVPRRPELLEMLSGLPGRCVVFTNASKEYARRVLAALGMFTVLVGGNGGVPPASPEGDGAEGPFRPHAVVGDVCDLPDVLHGFPPLALGNGGDGRSTRETEGKEPAA
jgi:phosphoglycolate phosphatase-like HAD superfamily hydrolase